jgi:L-alanine-DL-glutamate epimerase-like enolase superfamily enzyme
MVDANMRWSRMRDTRAQAFQPRIFIGWKSLPSRTMSLGTRVVREGGKPVATGEPAYVVRVCADDPPAATFPEPDVTNRGGVTVFMKAAARLAESFNLPVTSHGAHDVTVHSRGGTKPFLSRSARFCLTATLLIRWFCRTALPCAGPTRAWDRVD